MKTCFFLFILLAPAASLFSQGCSDAGFCSLGVLKNSATTTGKLNSFSIGVNYGAGEQNTSTINPYLEYTRKINEHLSLQTRITAAYASGFLGNNFNLGDVFVFGSYIAKPKAINKFTFLGGIKIPFTTANDKNDNGKPLPLDYQSSLGTYDLIAGINYIIRQKWEFNGGVQIPMIQNNKNSFFPDEYADPKANNFWPTNNFERKSDALARIGYYIHFKKTSITLKPNILTIYHLGKDSYEDRFGRRISIDGSDQLTINAGIIASKRFNNDHQLELAVAAPFVARDARPDGLTRSAVFNLQYSFVF